VANTNASEGPLRIAEARDDPNHYPCPEVRSSRF